MDRIVGLDIGTTKICAIIAEAEDNGLLKITGVGSSPSDGLKRGVVVNVEKTVQSIRTAIEDAQQMSGTRIDAVYAGIAGDHIRSVNTRAVVAVSGPDNEITPSDEERVIEAAKAVSIPMDREIVHVLPQSFVVDDQPGIKDPIGMSGVRRSRYSASAMKGTKGAMSWERVSRQVYSVCSAGPGWSPQKRRRLRRTYQLDRPSTKASSSRAAS